MQEQFSKSNSKYFNKVHNKVEIDHDQYLNQLLDLDDELKIKAFDDLKSFFTEVKFLNENIEEVYQTEKNKISLLFDSPVNKSPKKTRIISSIRPSNLANIDSDILINFVFIMGYTVSLIYLLYPFYNLLLLCLCCLSKFITCVIVFITYKLKKNEKYRNNRKIFFYIDHILIFISSFNLNLKILLLSIFFTSEDNEHSEELIRVIIYQFVSTNMYLIIKLEANIKITLFYFFKDFFCIFIAQLYSKKEHYYLLDGITSFATYMIFYLFRKIWDLKLRTHFAAKLKFKDFFFYVNDLINGLKGYHFNIFDDSFISFNEKFNDFVKLNQDENKFYENLIKDKIIKINEYNSLINEDNNFNNNRISINNDLNFQQKSRDFIMNNQIQLEEIINELKNDHKLYSIFNNNNNNNNLNYNLDSNDLELNQTNEKFFEELNLNQFLHNLILYNINSKTLSKSLEKSSIDSLSNKSDKNNDGIIDNYKDEDKTEKEECLFDILIEKINNNKEKEIFSVHPHNNTNKLSNFDNNQNVECLGVFEVKKNNVFLEKILQFFSNYESNKIKKSLTSKLDLKENENTNQENILRNINPDNSNNKFLKESYLEDSKDQLKFQKISNKNISLLIQTSTQSKKKYLRSAKNNNQERKISNKNGDKKEDGNKKDKFFEIFMRKVRFINGRIIYNLIFYDVTDLINSKNNLLKEDFHKTRLFAKIAHEFKTPLNSILSILYKISEEMSVNNLHGDSIDPSGVANNFSKGDIKFNNKRQFLNEKSSEDINVRKSYSSANVIESFNFKVHSNEFLKHTNRNKNYNNNNYNNEDDIKIKNNENKFLSTNFKDQILLAYDLINSINFLVSDIIILSNLNNLNQINIRNDNLNFNEIISSTNKILQTLIYLSKTKQKRIKTEIFIDSSISFDMENQNFIKSDESKIKQILFNFITNAVKFTNKGKITIEAKITNSLSLNDADFTCDEREFCDFDIKIKQVDQNNISNNNYQNQLSVLNDCNQKNYLCISVIDTGVGINDESQKNIFNSNFDDDYKNNKNIKDIFKIKGFGLMICKYLAKLMKIEIGFSSQENKGSRFFLMFPLENMKEVNFSSRITLENKNSFLGINSKLKEYLDPNFLNNNDLSSSNIDEMNDKIKIEKKSSKFKESINENDMTFLISKNQVSNMKHDNNNKNLFSTEIKNYIINNITEKKKKFVNKYPVTERERVDCGNFANIDSYRSMSKNNNDTINRSAFCNDKIKSKSLKLNNPITSIDNLIATRRNSILKIDDALKEISYERSSSSGGSFPKNNPTIKNLDNDSKTILIEFLIRDYILVADDNHLINDVNKRIIETCLKKLNANYEIILCTDGVDIIRNILNEKMKKSIKCIITDENMEFINGSEAIKFVRTLESKNYLKNIPIISVTSHEDKTIVNNILSSGANHVLPKPLTVSSMMNAFKLIDF